MSNLQYRIDLLTQLGAYMQQNGAAWQEAKTAASRFNPWFTPLFIEKASTAIARNYLNRAALEAWVAQYDIPAENKHPKKIGIVMAGNIPLVGFHDWLAVFITGHHCLVKLSGKDSILLTHLVSKMQEWDPALQQQTVFAEMLKGCDAYIATGSDNSARYFDYYFAKYPHIIRRNRSSVALLDGSETAAELDQLADDTHLYFGLGCRNVTKLLVPKNYDFVPLLGAFSKYREFFDHSRYKNNYDYQLAILLLNNKYYMTNGSVLLVENESIFSPISQLHYSYYDPAENPAAGLANNNSVQCIVGHGHIPFGKAQEPALTDYADGVDTMRFLAYL